MLTRKDAEALAREVRAVPYVAGSWHSGHALDRFAVTDPVTERTLTMVADAAQRLLHPAGAITGASSAMTIAREEIFGPAGTIIAFGDEDEAQRPRT